MSMSLPLKGRAAATRIEGFGASDISDRMALLLCKKHNRQFFVNAHVPRQPGNLQSGEEGSDETVFGAVVQQVNIQIKQESDSDMVDQIDQLSIIQENSQS